MGYFFAEPPFTSGDDVRVLRGRNLRTRSGWEQSSLKQNLLGDVRVPGGVNYGGYVCNLGSSRCARCNCLKEYLKSSHCELFLFYRKDVVALMCESMEEKKCH